MSDSRCNDYWYPAPLATSTWRPGRPPATTESFGAAGEELPSAHQNSGDPHMDTRGNALPVAVRIRHATRPLVAFVLITASSAAAQSLPLQASDAAVTGDGDLRYSLTNLA